MIRVFIGDNIHTRNAAADDFIRGFTSTHGAIAIDRFASEELDLSTLTDALSTPPFLTDRRMVIVRTLSANKLLAEKIEDIIKSVAETTDFVIIEPHLDTRSVYLKSLKALAELEEFRQLEGVDLAKWIVEYTALNGGVIHADSAQFLIDRVGTNQQLLANEIQKLILFNSNISKETIAELTSYTPQSSIFAMLDAAFAGQLDKALILYAEQRTQGMEPQAILGMISWQLHTLNTVRSAPNDMSVQDIASASKLSPFVVRKNQNHARRLSPHKITHLLELAIDTDKRLKSTKMNADDAVRTLIVSFA